MLEVVRPRYGAASLADILPSALTVFGVPGTRDRLGLAAELDGVRRLAVLLMLLAAAGVHVASAAYMLYFGFRGSTHLLLWVAGVAAVALVAYTLTVSRLKSVPDRG